MEANLHFDIVRWKTVDLRSGRTRKDKELFVHVVFNGKKGDMLLTF